MFDDPVDSPENVFSRSRLHVSCVTESMTTCACRRARSVTLCVRGGAEACGGAAYKLVKQPFDSHFQCHDYNDAVPAGLIMQNSTRPAAVTLFHVVSTACMKQDLNMKNLIGIQVLVYTVYFPRHLLRISFLKGSYHGFSYLIFSLREKCY